MLSTEDPTTGRPATDVTVAPKGNSALVPSQRFAMARGPEEVRKRLHRASARRSVPAILVGVLGVGCFFLPTYLLYSGSTALIAGLIGVALYLPIAALREMPLNAAGMTGLSAYTYALLATNGDVGHSLLGVLLALAAAVAVSLLGGVMSLAVTGLYFIVASLVIQVAIEKVAFSIPELTGGTSGYGVWQPVLEGWFDTTRAIYVIVGAVCLVVAVAIRRVLRSRIGFHWVLVGHMPEGASSVGIRNWVVKLTVFAVSGVLIGCAGVLSAVVNGTPPSSASFVLIFSVIYVAIPIASGLRDLSSIWLVAAAFTAIPIILEGYHLNPNLISGLILLIALGVGYNRDRISREMRGLWARVLAVRGPAVAVEVKGETPAAGIDGGGVALTGVSAEVWARPVGGSSLQGNRLVAATGSAIAAPTIDDRSLVTVGGDVASAEPAAPRRLGCMLEGTNIIVDFGGVRAVDRVHVRVGPGQRVGIVGANGAGKTTLFNALTGFVPLHEGRVTLDSDDITRQPSMQRARAGIRRTFQQPRLADVLTVEQNVVCGHGTVSAERRERVDWLMERFGLSAMRGAPVGELPFGVRRGVEVVRALAVTPRVLMLDEPASGLEDEEAEKLEETLLELQAREGWGLLAIEHDLKFITAVAQRLMVMENGRVLVEGQIDEVMAQAEVRRVYLGEMVTA